MRELHVYAQVDNNIARAKNPAQEQYPDSFMDGEGSELPADFLVEE
jgi:hypothetical protein